MELLYKVKPDIPLKGGEEYLSDSKRIKLLPKRGPLVAISVKNLIAFSSNIDLINNKRAGNGSGTSSGTGYSGSGSSLLGSGGGAGSNASLNLSSSPWNSPFTSQTTEISGAHVYIADLNTPWEYNFLKNSSSQISHMQWDHAGTKLLIGSEDGQVEVYGMSDNLLNKWQLIYSASFPGEPILSSCWLGMPRKVQVVVDKIDSLIYSEKYHTSLLPNSRGFGGKSLDGCVVITATGLVGGLIHCSFEEPLKVISAKQKISAVRNQVVCADMSYSKSGEIVVVTCGDSLKHPILVNRVDIKLIGFRDKAQVNVLPSQSLFLPPSFSDYAVTSIKFVNKISADSIYISLLNHTTNSSVVCLYELIQESVQLKPRFQTTNPEKLINLKWQLKSQLQFSAAILDTCSLSLNLATTTFALSGMSNTLHLQNLNSQANSLLTPLISLSLSSGIIVLARSDNLQQIGSININSTTDVPSNISSIFPIKRERDDFDEIKLGAKPGLSFQSVSTEDTYVSMGFSWSGSLLITLTANSHLNVYKMHPNIDPSNATMLIELSMMGGLDPWDVMMCLRQNQIENITDRLSETFARQPPSVQTHFNARILVIKAALYRMACGGAARTNDQTTLLTLHLVSGALKALLRPGDLSSLDKGPAESLSSLLSSKGEQLADVDKVLVHLVPKEYTVEPSTLQSLQQFLQWCADLALKLLATLPDLRHSHRAPLWEVCRDSKAISILRELIVLMRIWGLIRPSCLPSFRKTSENLDVLPLLFRLLTRLSVAPHDPDESLIDECCLLPSEVQVPNYNPYVPCKNFGISSNLIFTRGHPLSFEFGKFPIKTSGSEGNGSNWMDGLRLLWLGKNPTGIKVCNRCGCCTLTHLPPRSAANKAWDQRWMRCCPCGGNWKIPSYLPQPKVVDPDNFLNF